MSLNDDDPRPGWVKYSVPIACGVIQYGAVVLVIEGMHRQWLNRMSAYRLIILSVWLCFVMSLVVCRWALHRTRARARTAEIERALDEAEAMRFLDKVRASQVTYLAALREFDKQVPS